MLMKKWIGIITLVALAGCAQPIKKQAFNKEASGNIRTLAISQSKDQESYDALVLGHPGMSFGLIGGLIAASDMQSKSNQLTAAIDPKETRLQERFAMKLSASLARSGYAVKVVPASKDATEDQVVNVLTQSAGTDGVLAVTVLGRYLAAGPATDYFPYVLVKVKKVDSKSGNVLYEDTFSYGYASAGLETVHFASDASYRFANIDSLVANPAKTREGLIAGLDAIIAQITADLKKN